MNPFRIDLEKHGPDKIRIKVSGAHLEPIRMKARSVGFNRDFLANPFP